MKIYLFVAMLSICSMCANAQKKTGTEQSPIYMMPDGTIISKDKIDSVSKAWNGAIFIGKEDKDKDKGVLHLIRLSDSEMKQINEKNAKDELVLKGLIGKPAADFDLIDMRGKHWSLKALRGKVVVLNFWYTSCPPCLQEMPKLNEITGLYSADKVVFLALTFNEREKVKQFLQLHKFNYIILPGSKTVDQQYGITGWPTSLVIDKKGKISAALNISEDIKQDLVSAIDKNLH
ncbi:TlpA disulfide reductase family protein [Mucilaginibacter sp. CAU 1740]|uniref:TlpA family protein disulfide reductase n=1 Tax=Mucilaginibacter sp. CAU 1740 TaxID=3140365 RepID=UPI00325C0980